MCAVPCVHSASAGLPAPQARWGWGQTEKGGSGARRSSRARAGAPEVKEEEEEPAQEGALVAQVGIRPCFYWISETSRAEAIESGEDSERTMTLAERSRWLTTLAKGECQDAVLVLPRLHGDPSAVFAGARPAPAAAPGAGRGSVLSWQQRPRSRSGAAALQEHRQLQRTH